MSVMTNYVSEVIQHDHWGEEVKKICNTMLENSDNLSAVSKFFYRLFLDISNNELILTKN